MGKQNNISLAFRVKALEDELKHMKVLLKELTGNKRFQKPDEPEDDRIMNFNEALKLLNIPRHVLY